MRKDVVPCASPAAPGRPFAWTTASSSRLVRHGDSGVQVVGQGRVVKQHKPNWRFALRPAQIPRSSILAHHSRRKQATARWCSGKQRKSMNRTMNNRKSLGNQDGRYYAGLWHVNITQWTDVLACAWRQDGAWHARFRFRHDLDYPVRYESRCERNRGAVSEHEIRAFMERACQAANMLGERFGLIPLRARSLRARWLRLRAFRLLSV